MKIYFAGAIRGGRNDAARYHAIVEQLRYYGEILTEHVADSALRVLGQDIGDQNIHARDLEWLKAADVLVAEVTTPSLGVGYEIGKASEWNKRILCLYRPGEGRALSAMIAGCPDVVICEYQNACELEERFVRFFTSERAASNNQS